MALAAMILTAALVVIGLTAVRVTSTDSVLTLLSRSDQYCIQSDQVNGRSRRLVCLSRRRAPSDRCKRPRRARGRRLARVRFRHRKCPARGTTDARPRLPGPSRSILYSWSTMLPFASMSSPPSTSIEKRSRSGLTSAFFTLATLATAFDGHRVSNVEDLRLDENSPPRWASRAPACRVRAVPCRPL